MNRTFALGFGSLDSHTPTFADASSRYVLSVFYARLACVGQQNLWTVILVRCRSPNDRIPPACRYVLVVVQCWFREPFYAAVRVSSSCSETLSKEDPSSLLAAILARYSDTRFWCIPCHDHQKASGSSHSRTPRPETNDPSGSSHLNSILDKFRGLDQLILSPTTRAV